MGMNTELTPKKNFLLQTFIKKNLEEEFLQYFSNMMRFNHRVGIYLSIFAWMFATTGIIHSFNISAWNLTWRVLLLIPIFISVIISSYRSKNYRWSQILAAMANVIAALILLYIAVFMINDAVVLITGIIVILFFSSCILRIRFHISIFLTLLELIIAQTVILQVESFHIHNLSIITVALWTGWFCSNLGGYLLEKSDRSLFLLQKQLRTLNDELREKSFIDPLTKLYNRLYFFEALNNEFRTATRFNKTLTVAMLDLDHFKRINDELGHPVGDSVLMELSKLLKESFRDSDVVARYGGEEFIILFRETNLFNTQLSLERFLQRVRTYKFTDVPWQITCSAGLAERVLETDVMDLIKKADDKLYLSKKHGRNMVSS